MMIYHGCGIVSSTILRQNAKGMVSELQCICLTWLETARYLTSSHDTTHTKCAAIARKCK